LRFWSFLLIVALTKFDAGGKVVSATLERLKQLFIAKFDFNIEELKPTTTLEILGLDSLDIIEFMFDMEKEFNIRIPDQEFKVTTIQEMVDALDRFISEQRIRVSGNKQS
jgi:acyl carrier protein